jgi:hypothetical protein
LLAALRNRESQHRALLDRIAQQSQLDGFEPSAVLAELQGRLPDWRSLLRDNAPSARGLLKQLLVGRLEMQPDLELGFYRFSGIGTVEPILAGLIAVPLGVASLTFVSWNQVGDWLRRLEALRRVA